MFWMVYSLRVEQCDKEGGEEMGTRVCRSVEETGRLGNEIYERDIRPRVEDKYHGKMVAIDVDSGDYAIDEEAMDAAERLRERRPGADIWCLRIGYGVLRHFGARSLRRAQ